MATAPRIRTIRSSSPPSDGGLISSTINPTISAVSAAARSGGPMASLTYVRLERLAADGPGLRAHVLLQRDRNDRLGLVPVVDRVAARRLRGVFPARLHELERTAILAAAADRVRVLARLALGRLVRPMLVVARGLVPQRLYLLSPLPLPVPLPVPPLDAETPPLDATADEVIATAVAPIRVMTAIRARTILSLGATAPRDRFNSSSFVAYGVS